MDWFDGREWLARSFDGGEDLEGGLTEEEVMEKRFSCSGGRRESAEL